MNHDVRLLIAEDSEDDALLLLVQLQKSGFTTVYERVDSKAAMQRALSDDSWDAVISDYVMPGFDAMAALEVLTKTGIDIPFIIVSGQIGEETAAAAMRAGARDFLTKKNLVRLGPVLERELQEAKTRQEKRIAEKNALEAEALKRMSVSYRQFVSNISHELRTPLSTVKGFITTLLAKDVNWSEEEKIDFLMTANKEVDRLSAMIGDMLDLCSIDAGKLPLARERCDIQGILNSIKGELRTITSGSKLEMRIPARKIRVTADSVRIGQVIVNLVDNAVKYSGPGSPIEIAARRTKDGVVVSVKDSGQGIPVKVQPAIFDRYFQHITKGAGRKGVGLGLPICKSIIDAHGGKIWVESKEGAGSKFSFSIPAK